MLEIGIRYSVPFNSVMQSIIGAFFYFIISTKVMFGLPRWLSGLRHSVHRLERSAGGAGFNPRIGRYISCSDFRGACFEINFSGRQRKFDGVLYNL